MIIVRIVDDAGATDRQRPIAKFRPLTGFSGLARLVEPQKAFLGERRNFLVPLSRSLTFSYARRLCIGKAGIPRRLVVSGWPRLIRHM